MHVADVITRLQGFHDRIDAVLKRTRAALDAPAPDGVGLAHLRWELLRLLREYQLFKHGEIFDPQLRAGDLARRGRAAALKSRCIEMAGLVADHSRRWTIAGTADVASYADETRALMTRLTQHLVRERLGVADLLDGLQWTRQA